MNILVTGGAGYIGSVVVEELVKEGNQVVVIDNLSQGHRGAVDTKAEFICADLGDLEKLADVFRNHDIQAVIHLAASSLVGQSLTEPAHYFQNNVVCGMNLLHAMRECGVNKLVFSSSAAVYGLPEEVPIAEEHPTIPINPYGESKLMFEKVLGWYGQAYGLSFISLRYFNAAGATPRLGEDHRPETHLIPIILKASLDGDDHINVFGTDYPTKDGSCIRDYVHVVDIASAHILALENIEQLSGNVYNLGNGHGYSVFEVIEVAQKVTGIEIAVKSCPRRTGDPPVLVADYKRARSELGWKIKYPALEAIIGSAWEWLCEHHFGYER
jgi:UDP-glucose 4-epimerase